MNRFEALVSLNMVPDIGSIRLARLLEFFGTPENVVNAPQDKLTAIFGVGEKIAMRIHGFQREDLEKELHSAKKQDIRIMTVDDSDYPENLKNIPDPPIVLYVKGELKKEDNDSIAIIGSRRASFYGLHSAEKFAAELSERGLTVVSGMARGVDSYAHKGALKANGRSIAVIGSGFSHLYPPENKDLAGEIAKKGAVISEFPMDTLPLRQNFPRRNRVISGLSLGVLVVEAARNSGALITADFALEQGREVFALPGEVDSRTSYGTNGLIKQGAKLVSCTDDIMEELHLNAAGVPEPHFQPQEILSFDTGSDEESVLYAAIPEQPIHLDDLIEKTTLDIPRISAILLKLQMKRLIRQLPGKQFVRSQQ